MKSQKTAATFGSTYQDKRLEAGAKRYRRSITDDVRSKGWKINVAVTPSRTVKVDLVLMGSLKRGRANRFLARRAA
jgi:hypothetical protein